MKLVIAAYWAEDDVSLDAIKLGGHIAGSGAIVSIAPENVDDELRRFLRRLQLQEAARFKPEAA